MLPELPSDLIEVALRDLEAVERDERYTVDMREWHKPRLDRKCSVCLAGAVMAKSLDCKRSEDLTPASLISNVSFDDGEAINGKLCALDHFRLGEFRTAFEALNYDSQEFPGAISYDFDVTPYVHSPAQFKADMHSLAGLLRANGY